MQANDILTNVRIQTQASNPQQRWSNAQLLPLVSQAQQLIVREILWPVSYYIFQTVTGVARYQVPEILDTLQVYVQGQPLIRSDIETLEGDLINYYDQSGQGGGPGGFTIPGLPMVLAGGQFTPQWTSQAPATYPVASSLGTATDVSCPWYPGQRPRYYYDGGVIGLLPPPAGVSPVVVRCIKQPADLSELTDNLDLPTIAKMALVWKTIELMMFANAEQPAASDQRNYAMSQYKEEIVELRKWKRQYDGSNGTKGPIFLTYRNFYARGNNRNFGGLE